MKVIFTLNIIIFLSLIGYCQQSTNLRELDSGLYSDGITISKLHKFESYFNDFPQRKETFKKFNKARKNQRNFNYAASIAAVIGLRYISDGNGYHTLLIGIPCLVAGGTTALIGNSIFGKKKNKHKNVLLGEINNLNMGFSENGLGMFLSF